MPRPPRRDETIAAAVELLDDEGLDGLSLRRLAQRTGASATSIYWYVQNKRELVALALDAVVAEVPLPDVERLGWRDAAAELARGFRALVLRHPWLGIVAATYPDAYGRRLAEFNEHALDVYAAAGFDDETADHAFSSVTAFVLGSAIGQAGPRAWAPAGPADPDVDAFAAARAAADGFPRLNRRIDALEKSDAAAAADATFELGLRAVLDGLEALREDRTR